MALTYDALGRWAEKFSGGDYIQAVYDPAGRRLALMVNGSTLGLARVSLAGDAVADYSSTGLNSYVHPDWLGSTRIKSTPGRTFLNGNDLAFAPFGEQYVTIGSVDAFFTVATHDLEVDLTDFPAREYHATQGRWLTPDPAGLGAVDLTNPQSWNRYAYVGNNPLAVTDPSGMNWFTGIWDTISNWFSGGGPTICLSFGGDGSCGGGSGDGGSGDGGYAAAGAGADSFRRPAAAEAALGEGSACASRRSGRRSRNSHRQRRVLQKYLVPPDANICFDNQNYFYAPPTFDINKIEAEGKAGGWSPQGNECRRGTLRDF